MLAQHRLRIALGLLWLLDGALQLQPYMFSRHFAAIVIGENTMGGPNLLTPFIHHLALLEVSHRVAYDILFAFIQLGMGIALIFWSKQTKIAKITLAISVVWALQVWVVGEGLGGLLFPQDTMAMNGAPGAALIYAILALVLWPRDVPEDNSPSVAGSGLMGNYAPLLIWALIWIGTGLLELEHSNFAANALGAQLRQAGSGEPSWIAFLDRGAASLLFGKGTEVAFLMLIVQAWIGYGALREFSRKAALATGIAVSLVYWVLGQNFGGLFTGQATDPNLGPVMVAFAFSLWPRARMLPMSQCSAPGVGQPLVLPTAGSIREDDPAPSCRMIPREEAGSVDAL